MVLIASCTTSPTPDATQAEAPTQPQPTITACDPAQFIDVLREGVPYEESVVSYNYLNETADLTAWFVDPDLDPQARESEIQGLTELAFRHSVEIAHVLASTESCVTALFDSVTVIAVDPLYHAWYVGAVPAFQIPISETLSAGEMSELEANFSAGYQRTERVFESEIPEPPDGSCTWPEARQNIENSIPQSRKNIAIYYTIEPEDASVYVQWTIPPVVQTADQIMEYFFLVLPNIDSAVSCLFPEFDSLWLFYIREDGSAQWVFAVDGDAVRDQDHQVFIENLEPIIQQVEE
jgi:hypothetical protein